MNYSRVGLYIDRKKKERINTKEKKGIDWINVLLFVALIVVVLAFLFLK